MSSTIQWGRKRGMKRLNGFVQCHAFHKWWHWDLNPVTYHSDVLFPKWVNWQKVPPQVHFLLCPLPIKLYNRHTDSFAAPGTHKTESPLSVRLSWTTQSKVQSPLITPSSFSSQQYSHLKGLLTDSSSLSTWSVLIQNSLHLELFHFLNVCRIHLWTYCH